MKDAGSHLVEYIVLFLISGVIGVLFFYYRYDRSVLLFLSGLFSFAYIAWGLIHHALEDRLTKFVAGEYIMFGVLIFFLLFTVLSLE